MLKHYNNMMEWGERRLGMHLGMFILIAVCAMYFAARIGGQVVGPAASGAVHVVRAWLVSEGGMS